MLFRSEIDTIRTIEETLTQLLPEARIRVAHGQMRERELELAMRDFYQQRFNILLCTTIIETGIDVPTANTIIINRADRFGLAQLHQLRGRVGRSHHQAYAYLLLPDEGNVTSQAKKRLEAIQSMEELGSGFFLAMHDLEIRGAGEVLGESQSGEMQEVGFNMYAAMLDTAVRALKEGKTPDLAAPLGVTTEINLHVPALLPDSYCSDVHERLVLYKRLASCGDDEEFERLREELIDRFGELPPPTEAIFRLGIAYPVRAEIQGRGVGAVRHCVFSTGLFVEPIEVWDEPRLLRFSVTRNPEPMREWTPYREVHPPHLNGFLVSRRGQFLLTPLPGGRTRLEGTTWYHHSMWPAPYWQVWSDAIIHTIHRRVLVHVKQLAEEATP